MTLVEIKKLFNPISLYRENKRLQIQIKAIAQDKFYDSVKKEKSILILGASFLKKNVICGIMKEFGYRKDQIEIRNDYVKNKRFDLRKIQYSNKYAGILIGPVAHKVVGVEDYNSVVQKLRSESGYPLTMEIRSENGNLKITKSAFKKVLKNLSDSLKKKEENVF